MGEKRPSKTNIPIRTGPPESASTMTSTVSHHNMDASVSTQRSDKSPTRWSEASAEPPKSAHHDDDDGSSNASGSDNDDDDESVISQAHSAAQSVSVSLQTSKGRGRSKSNKSRSSPDDTHKEKVAGGRVSKKPKKKANRFACTGYDDCNLSFTRSEHLIRHIRKHTGERPYECHCGRRFSRLDNLRQHASTVHANEDIPNDSLAASVAGFRRPGAHDDMASMPSISAMPMTHGHGHSRSLSHPNTNLPGSAPVYGAASVSGPSGHHPSAGPPPGSHVTSSMRPLTAEYSSSPFPSGSSFQPASGHSSGVPATSGHPGPALPSSASAAPPPLSRRPVRGHNKAFSTSNIAYDPREARSQPYPKYHSARPPQLPPLAIDRPPYESSRQQQQQQQQTPTYSHSAHPSVSSTREYPYGHRPVTPTDCPTPASATFSHTAGSPGWEHNTISSPLLHTPSAGHSQSQSQSYAHSRTRSMVTPSANGFSHSHSTPSTLGQLNHGRRYPDGLRHSHSDANNGHNRRMSVPSLNGGSPPYESPVSLTYRMHERRDSFEQAAEDSRRRSIYHSPPMQPRLPQATSPPDSPTRRSGDVWLPGIQSLLPSTPELPFTGYSRAPMPTNVHQRPSTSVRFADDDHPAHAQRQRDMEYQHREGPPPTSSSSSSAYPFRGHSYTESAPLNSISGRPSRNFRRMARHMEEEEPRIVSSSAGSVVSASANNNMSGGSRQHQHPSNPNVTNRTGHMEHPNLTQFGFPGREPVQQPLPPISSPQPSQQQHMSDMARLDALVAVATSQKEKPLTARV